MKKFLTLTLAATAALAIPMMTILPVPARADGCSGWPCAAIGVGAFLFGRATAPQYGGQPAYGYPQQHVYVVPAPPVYYVPAPPVMYVPAPTITYGPSVHHAAQTRYIGCQFKYDDGRVEVRNVPESECK